MILQSETCETSLILKENSEKLKVKQTSMFHFASETHKDVSLRKNGKSPIRSRMFQMFHFVLAFRGEEKFFDFLTP
jgi:hypothetical protein